MSATLVHETAPAESRLPHELFGYEIVDFIGEGAGSMIYVAAEPCTGQLYALKHVIRRREKDLRFFEQLQNEYNVSRGLAHPNLRRILHYKDNGGLLRRANEAMLLMELLDATPLDALGGRGVQTLIDVFLQVAAGLGALHAAGCIHCDLKPGNILLSPDGTAHIIDLGQACPAGTVKQRIQGTPDFIAPEQVRCEPVTPRTDVFNLGATFYWALTRRNIPTLYNLVRAENSFLVDERIAPPHELDSAIPVPLSNLIMECIRTSPGRRPPDMAELGRRLETVRHAISRAA